MIHAFSLFVFALLLQPGSFTVTTPAFTDEGAIPAKYTCEGKNVNPQLNISNIPEGTRTLAVIMDDPDAAGQTFDHWVVFNIEPSSTIAENSAPGTQGVNSKENNNYTGPCPPSGTHRYFFKIYALDVKLPLKAGATKQQLEEAMKGHILASAQLMGTYQKTSKG